MRSAEFVSANRNGIGVACSHLWKPPAIANAAFGEDCRVTTDEGLEAGVVDGDGVGIS